MADHEKSPKNKAVTQSFCREYKGKLYTTRFVNEQGEEHFPEQVPIRAKRSKPGRPPKEWYFTLEE